MHLCAHCGRRGEHVNVENGQKFYCDECYMRVYWLPQTTAEKDGAKVTQRYARAKSYVQHCLRPEILALVETLLIRLGVPNIEPPKKEEKP